MIWRRALAIIGLLFIGGAARVRGDATSDAAARYNACLDGLGGQVSTSPLVTEVASAYAATVKLGGKAVAWNVNRPYRAGDINLLVPGPGVTALPARCGAAPPYPSCWSFAASRQIICNPAMARHLQDPGLDVPSVMARIASGRFMFFEIVGHEVGHLQRESSLDTATHHDLDTTASLTCHALDAARDAVEASCDEVGIRLACDAIKNSNAMPAPLAYGRPDEDVKLLFALQEWLDHYHVADDICLGNSSYESFAFRVQRFGAGLLECFGAGAGNTALAIQQQWSAAFARTESLLRRDQKRGWAATPDYGVSHILHQRTLATPKGPLLLELDSDGRTSALRVLDSSPDAPARSTTPLVQANGVMRPLRVTWDGTRWQVDVDADGPQRTLVHFTVTCRDWRVATTCSQTHQEWKWNGAGDIAVSGDGGVLVVDGDRMKLFGTRAALGSNKPSFATQSLFMPGETFKVATIGAHGSAVALAMNVDGLFVGDLIMGGKHRPLSLMLPKDTRVDAMTLLDKRVLFLLSRRDLNVFEPAELWDCPQQVLYVRKAARCSIYEAPAGMTEPVALVTRAMSSVDGVHIEPAAPGCPAMVSVSDAGWTWLVRRDTGKRALVVADGIAGCVGDSVIGYRAGRNDLLTPQWEKSGARTEQLPSP